MNATTASPAIDERIITVTQAPGGFDPPRATLVASAEAGKVLVFPGFPFALQPEEQRLLDPAIADPKRKNISLDPGNDALRGVLGDPATQAAAHGLVARYFNAASDLVARLFPEYTGALRPAPTSLRLQQVETRQTSWRKDDSRLHVDAFPSRPLHGERILRVFLNIHPAGVPRVWRIGEPFEAVAAHFLPRIKPQWPGKAALLAVLKITKRRRSDYDHTMLQLHDAMKVDADYQLHCDQRALALPPGTAWVCFSDQTSHAAMSGQFMLEQTFFLPAASMVHPELAPLAVLQRQLGRSLI
ncbi:MAG: 3-deoxy-D-manno-oct-2-ulosonic acid (Kdo) hydroxylase [Rhodanobacteraceae bacterium]|nr:MAG: 3-deoxy-D-manno-oct-2-ulosonic acid (Kdo) hydroxylase [Rhodanobacteraceae bacterium]